MRISVDPTAMCLATVDDSGRPRQRVVLLKGFDESGFVFYTNLSSRKALNINSNSQASIPILLASVGSSGDCRGSS
jgi:pyridoxamine 5'-phosphate oxidase